MSIFRMEGNRFSFIMYSDSSRLFFFSSLSTCTKSMDKKHGEREINAGNGPLTAHFSIISKGISSQWPVCIDHITFFWSPASPYCVVVVVVVRCFFHAAGI